MVMVHFLIKSFPLFIMLLLRYVFNFKTCLIILLFLLTTNRKNVFSFLPVTQPPHFVTFSFIVCRITNTLILQEARKINEDKVPHSSWGNYDDFNEYFW